MGEKSVRGTEVNDFLRCRTKWNYAWNERLVAKTPNDKLLFGTMFHIFLEHLYKHDSVSGAIEKMQQAYDAMDLSNSDQVQTQETWELLKGVAENYTKQWQQTDWQYEVLATELQFAIPLSDKLTYTGTIDLVLKDKNGQVWFMDHKTTASVESYEKRADMDRQISRYWWALQKLGYDVAGFIYNIILKDIPEPPAVLKSGKLSQNKSQKTTYQMYHDAILANGESPSDYEEILNHLKAQETADGNRFFKRVKVYRLQAEIDNSIEELAEVSHDMNDARIYRNITKDCSWDCQYQSICQSSMDGSNVDYLTEQLFTKEV